MEYNVYCEGKLIVEQEMSLSLAISGAEEYLFQKCVDGDLEFGDFDIVLKEYNDDGDPTGVIVEDSITIEDQPTDLEEHSIYNAHDLGVRCGKRF